MKTINQILNYRILALLFAGIAIVSCSDDDDIAPAEENEVEVITNVSLIFTPMGGGTPVTAEARDPDGEGIQELETLDDIVLAPNTTYTMTYTILSALDPDDVEDIAEEISEEDDEHQFFYSFTNNIFSSPMGNGNIDVSSDPMNYNDQDENGLPVGLSTSFTTGAAATGTFTARLQHQPDLKSATTGANDGDTDFNLMFNLIIQ